MKRLIVAAALISAAAGAQAQQSNWIVEGIGAVTGAVLCSELGGGNARYVASGVCAYAGAQIARKLTTPNTPPVYPVQPGQPGMVYAPPQPVYQDNCLTDGYFKGEYNPAAARAYCRGAVEAQRRAAIAAERDAYYEGLRSSQQLERDAHRWGAANNMYTGY
jgi:hypothetical protein